MSNQRINIAMDTDDMAMAMGGINPGGITVCAELITHSDIVDPGVVTTYGFQKLMALDTLGIYEHRIWMLYKDVCNKDIGKMIAVIRAHQLGIDGADADTINHAIDNRGDGIDVDALVLAVQKQLPDFNVKAVIQG